MRMENNACKEKKLTSSIITSTAVLLGLYLNNGAVVKADSLPTGQDITKSVNNSGTTTISSVGCNENSITESDSTNDSQTNATTSTNGEKVSQPVSETSDLTRSVKTYNWNGINVTFDDTTGILTIPGGTETEPVKLNNDLPIYNGLIGPSGTFRGFESIKEIKITGKIKIKYSAKEMFSRLVNLTSISGLDQLDTSEVPNMANMFYNCRKLTSIDLSHFDTSNVTNMSYMFTWCDSLTNLDVTSFDTTKVTDMSGMFLECLSLTNIDVTGFNTSKVTSMSSMFDQCVSLTNLDVTGFDTSNVTRMSNLFCGCGELTNLDVTNFDTSKVISMDKMFYGCKKLTNLDVTNFNTSNVTNMSNMFRECSSLTNLDVTNFDTGKVTNMAIMFGNCRNLPDINVSNFNTANVTSMQSMFFACESLTNLNLSNFNTANVTIMQSMFFACESLTNLNLSSFDMSNVIITKDMLGGVINLSVLNLGPKCMIQNAGLTNSYTISGVTVKLNPNSKWVNVADGTIDEPNGNKVWTPAEMERIYNGPADHDTYVRSCKVRVHYQDEAGDSLIGDKTISGLYGKHYTSLVQANIPGYTFKEIQGNTTGTFSDLPEEVTLIYKKNPVTPSRPVVQAKVVVHYQDENGDEIVPDEVLTGRVGDNYQSVQKTINGYTFKEVRGNATGRFTANEQTVIYIYTKDDETVNTTLPNYVPKPAKPNNNKSNNTNKITGTNSQTAKDKNQQKAVKPLAGDPNEAKPDSLPQTGASNEDKGILSIFGSMMLLISSIGGAWFKRKQK